MTDRDLGQSPGRLAVAGLLAATAVAGLLFTPVFGLSALAPPVLVVVLVGYGCFELCRRVLTSWRPVFVLLLGIAGLFASVPGTTPAVLARAVTQGWLLTLESTWPARPDAEQLLFVPILVLLATVLGLELLLRLRKRVVALLPGLAVAGLSQAYQALTGLTAILAALAFLAPAGLVLNVARPGRPRLSGMSVLLVVPTVVAIVAGVAVIGTLDPVGREPYRLADSHAAAPPENGLSNPLHEIAARLAAPGQEVFRYRTDATVDRWRLLVLDTFDGANWSTDTDLRRLGVRLDGTTGGKVDTADVRITGLTGPWLPSQQNPVSVTGTEPLVDTGSGALLSDSNARNYTLSWSEVDAGDLSSAQLDPQAVGGLGGLGVVPDDIGQLAQTAVHGMQPSLQAALQLERFLTENYRVATGDNLPTGDGWPQLRQFLTQTKVGTSEQFAAAYVALARIIGIPARLVVGYRGATETSDGYHVVRNRDVQAWPEVAVAGVGWVPLDPTASAQQTQLPQTGISKAAAQARSQLPPENQLQPQPDLPPDTTQDQATSAGTGMGWAVLIGAGALVVCWIFGVPLAKAVRTRRRRKRAGAAGVLGAWAEVRDLLIAHRVPYRVGMTPRDLAATAGAKLGVPLEEPMYGLAGVLDFSLWARHPAPDGAAPHAWAQVRAIRRALARRPWRDRLRAALESRTLLRKR
ncbi:transglutaminase domain-containing protein [Amycolatopsis acidicola]|uniref:Transglutaminase domain-containing protein n=1 Tax=Amycolatopsis acidicola TaxID=2596893 RepID=A0A5N0UTY2_9PSEU|nr:transglutaminase-like domain-containing protein [Amycolatopsis acidicola]KAA9155798.1 transglutaminase domain-containing protein [Amycolatopsis acidicola]